MRAQKDRDFVPLRSLQPLWKLSTACSSNTATLMRDGARALAYALPDAAISAARRAILHTILLIAVAQSLEAVASHS
jgi:hypothetical protein